MNLRTLATFAAIAVASLSANLRAADSDTYRSSKTLGLQTGYISHNRSAVAGVEFSYRFSRHFRLAPSVLYAFRHYHQDALLISLDAQTPIPFGGQYEWYPLVGVCYTTWTFHTPDAADNHDVSTRTSRLGLNLGAGFNFNLTSTLQLGIQARYQFVSHTPATIITARIAYCF